MSITIHLSSKQEKLLKAYRERRRIQRDGRVLTSSSAVMELLDMALSGVKPLPDGVTFEQIVERVEALEAYARTACPDAAQRHGVQGAA